MWLEGRRGSGNLDQAVAFWSKGAAGSKEVMQVGALALRPSLPEF